MQLSRREIRKLILEELTGKNNQRHQRQRLNEMTGMEALIAAPFALMGIGIIAISGLGFLHAIGDDIEDYFNETGPFTPRPKEEVTRDLVDRAQTDNNLRAAAENIGKDVEGGKNPEQAVRDELTKNSEAAKTIRSIASSTPRRGDVARHPSGYAVDPEDDSYYDRKYRGGIFGGMEDYRDM